MQTQSPAEQIEKEIKKLKVRREEVLLVKKVNIFRPLLGSMNIGIAQEESSAPNKEKIRSLILGIRDSYYDHSNNPGLLPHESSLEVTKKSTHFCIDWETTQDLFCEHLGDN